MYTSYIDYIPEIAGCSKITLLDKGYSNDKKFLVHMGGKETGNKGDIVLRTSPIAEYDVKCREFEIMMVMESMQIKMSKPISIGKSEKLGICYVIVGYIDGVDAIEGLPKYSSYIQYSAGLEAGNQLHKMHRLRAPSNILSWYNRKSWKNAYYTQKYLQSNIRLSDEERILEFIKQNEHIMKNRPNLFQHDDFHVGNIIIKDGAYAGVIDFNRWDWGDPYHEFEKLAFFSSELSIPFSIGQIKGYFGDKAIPDEFWRYYSLYAAMNCISSTTWVQKVCPEELNDMLWRINRVIEEHKGFELLKPTWYK